MPDRLSFDEAMRLAKVSLKVQDLDLKNGQVEMMTMPTALGPLPVPWGAQGGFAVVYKYRTQSGKLRALRCFVVKMTPDTQFRYERLGSYFAAHAPAITAEFRYHDQGIVIKEIQQGQVQKRVYPLIEMEWIEGLTLLEHVDELCRKRDRAGLQRLSQRWIELLRTLRLAQIAHGDLAGGNIMVRPDGRLVLVDYDGVYIPDFAGRLPIVEGQADYQHPQMNQRPFNEQADNFSALVISTALLALQSQPELWEQYTLQNKQSGVDKRLLFMQQDFLDPQRSPLFATLEQSSDARVRMAVQALKQACGLAVGQVQFPLQLIDPDFEKQQALARLRSALASRRVQQIVSAYDTELDTFGEVTVAERDAVRMAQDFVQAYQSDDDQAIITASQTIECSMQRANFSFTSKEQKRITLAQQRTNALAQFRSALSAKDIRQILAAYDPVLDGLSSVTHEERNLLYIARDFAQAYDADDDQAIVAASEVIQQAPYCSELLFTAQEEQRITLAQQHKAALVKFRLALLSKQAEQIVAAYDAVLVNCKNVTVQECEQLALAYDVLQAFRDDDDQAIVCTWESIENSIYHNLFILTVEEQQRLTLARQRIAALERFRRTVTSQEAEQIVLAYDPVLDGCAAVTAQERERLEAARRFMIMHEAVLDAIRANSDEQILAAYDEQLAGQFLAFTAEQQQRIARGLKRGRMESALQNKDYGCAIRLAQEIEMESHRELSDLRLTLAKQKFIKQFDVKNVEVWLQGNDVVARWHWPSDDLVRYALVLWRVDRWPQHPRKAEAGTQREWIFRNRNEPNGIARFTIARQMPIYLQVFLAIPDGTRQPQTWFFSSGDEPGSRKVSAIHSEV